MKAKTLKDLGCPQVMIKPLQKAARQAAASGWGKQRIRGALLGLLADPESQRDDPLFGALVQDLLDTKKDPTSFKEREKPAPWRQWGRDLEPASVKQMENACRLPIARRGALMPDAHLGYGLPIGGVLATEGAVIPYAVGVDIACRMKMTVLDLPVADLQGHRDKLERVLVEETRFGVGVKFNDPHDHPVMEEDWGITDLTQKLRDKAWYQLGTSGSGNHFVEYGEFEITEPTLGLDAGRYFALLSHSGSRGAGANVAGHYSRLARELHPELPKELKHLAWLDLDTEVGQEYWAAMELMGRYAAANHACIHKAVAKALKAKVMLDVENHHNFAWKEEHDGREMVVHRKGATPAGRGVLGIIPGSMATPAYIVQGRGNEDSLRSASHGAGRVMSRSQAKRTLTWSDARKFLKERKVHLMSAGLDEVPMVYKDIQTVMAAQADLVDILGKFHPRIVRMAAE